ncbi:MAG: single-stranded-DNA-specific exonuclease RecJ [Planctomycetes bacterium]|nr:single-stranded-DNA-specific exonuclease RecJ [Planctomycetota bacterium]
MVNGKIKAPRLWTVLPDNASRAEVLAKSCEISPLLASLLLNRSIDTPEKVRDFLKPNINNLHDAFIMKDMRKAISRIKLAIEKKQKIIVWGDYDVDGTVSTSLLVKFIRLLDGNCSYHIPSRIDEGYGLNKELIKEYKDDGIELIITVDTGVGSIEEIQFAQDIGLDVIITDHHVAGDELPNAYCIVNPKQIDCPYPHDYLAGAGVAFKVIWALAETLNPEKRKSKEFLEFFDNALGLVAIATIVDVVPMLDENRIFVKFGLMTLNKTTNPGLRALLEICNIDQLEIDPTHIGFRLGPRMNAGGRLGKEDLGVQLLLSDSYSDALKIVEVMESENKHRQEIEREIVKDAMKRVETDVDLEESAIIVLASKEWHAGVIGIVSTRLTEEFWRPAILISIDGDTGRGSARSIPEFNVYEGLKKCDDLLITFGGHNYAAGLELKISNIDTLRRRINTLAWQSLNTEKLHPKLIIECVVTLAELTYSNVLEIEKLSPFGEGNRPPMFISESVTLIGKPKIIGKDENHITFYVKDCNDAAPRGIRAIAFNSSHIYEQLLDNRAEFKIAYSPRINTYYGDPLVELVIKDFHF